MTPEQRQLTYGLVRYPPSDKSKISKEEFADQFPAALDGGKLALNILESACHDKSAEDLECALLIGYWFGFSFKYEGYLCRLITEDWHISHEDIARTLQRMGTNAAVPALETAAHLKFAYLDYDDRLGFARKCTWALADIGTKKAYEALERLATSSNTIIAGYAHKRLDNWQYELSRKRI